MKKYVLNFISDALWTDIFDDVVFASLEANDLVGYKVYKDNHPSTGELTYFIGKDCFDDLIEARPGQPATYNSLFEGRQTLLLKLAEEMEHTIKYKIKALSMLVE